MRILYLSLYKIYFDQILFNQKKIEYRNKSPYWTKRFSSKYDIIHFTNGYGNNRPAFDCELKNISFNSQTQKFELELGNILQTYNLY